MIGVGNTGSTRIAPIATTIMASTSKASTKRAPRSTPGGRLAIAILGGLALGLVAVAIYGMNDSGSDWAFNRPEAQLPSLQSKHTLQ
jgi:hypothetical protein